MGGAFTVGCMVGFALGGLCTVMLLSAYVYDMRKQIEEKEEILDAFLEWEDEIQIDIARYENKHRIS